MTRPGLVYLYECWEPATQERTLERRLCYACAHSLAFGCDTRRQPRKKLRPRKRPADPDEPLPPVMGVCESCEAAGREPVYEDEARARDAAARGAPAPALPRPAAPVVQSSTPAVEDDDAGQRGLFG